MSIDVQVTAEQIVGCTESTARSGLDVGNGSRVTVEDGEGTVLGSGTFHLSPGADSGDWTATVDDVDATTDFDRFDANGELAIVSRAELEQTGWDVRAHISITGSVTLES